MCYHPNSWQFRSVRKNTIFSRLTTYLVLEYPGVDNKTMDEVLDIVKLDQSDEDFWDEFEN